MFIIQQKEKKYEKQSKESEFNSCLHQKPIDVLVWW